jgi:hypothetical protein
MKALQAGGALPGDAFFRHALASHLWFKASGCPTFTGWFLGSPCIPSLVLGFRTPKLPLLPLWEKGVGGMRGKSVQPPPSPRVREGGRGDEGANTPNLPFFPYESSRVPASATLPVGHHASYSTRPSCKASRTSGVWDIHGISTGV